MLGFGPLGGLASAPGRSGPLTLNFLACYIIWENGDLFLLLSIRFLFCLIKILIIMLVFIQILGLLFFLILRCAVIIEQQVMAHESPKLVSILSHPSVALRDLAVFFRFGLLVPGQSVTNISKLFVFLFTTRVLHLLVHVELDDAAVSLGQARNLADHFFLGAA